MAKSWQVDAVPCASVIGHNSELAGNCPVNK